MDRHPRKAPKRSGRHRRRHCGRRSRAPRWRRVSLVRVALGECDTAAHGQRPHLVGSGQCRHGSRRLVFRRRPGLLPPGPTARSTAATVPRRTLGSRQAAKLSSTPPRNPLRRVPRMPGWWRLRPRWVSRVSHPSGWPRWPPRAPPLCHRGCTASHWLTRHTSRLITS